MAIRIIFWKTFFLLGKEALDCCERPNSCKFALIYYAYSRKFHYSYRKTLLDPVENDEDVGADVNEDERPGGFLWGNNNAGQGQAAQADENENDN